MKMISPETELRKSIDFIKSAKMGALIVLSDSQKSMELMDGGFNLDTDFDPMKIYELAKMDGAICVNKSLSKILKANVMLKPDHSIPTNQTGTRHKSADRFSKQTGDPVVAISEERGTITLFYGQEHYTFKSIQSLISKMSQGVQTIEKYNNTFKDAIAVLDRLELENRTTIYDVANIIDKQVKILVVNDELFLTRIELGSEGKLSEMLINESVSDVRSILSLILRDYVVDLEMFDDKDFIEEGFMKLYQDGKLTFESIAEILGYHGMKILESTIQARGYRILSLYTGMPLSIIDKIVRKYGNLHNFINESEEGLQEIDGIGPTRSRQIVLALQGLKRRMGY
jgi:diadenylate cyclase